MTAKTTSSGGDPDKERRIDWGEYSSLCRLLVSKVQEAHSPEAVVGVAHGGVIVGATVATILARDFFPIKFSRRVNAQVVRKHSKLLVPPTADLAGKDILIVDDCSHSGETLKEAIKAVTAKKPREVITAVLVQSGDYEPDFVGSYFAGKVVFPWQFGDGEEGRSPAGEGRPRRGRGQREDPE